MDGCAQVLGISASWVSKLRLRFIKGFVVRTPDVPRPGGRNRQNLSIEEERAFLAPFIKQAASGGILVVGTIKAALDAHLGRITSLAATYNMLHRHDWRKLAPDKHHPKSDPEAQLAWKKNSLKRSAISMKTGQTDKN